MSAPSRSSWPIVAGVMALLAAHATLALWSASHHSVAFDEIFHVTGGYLYDSYGDYRIHPENGVLPQRLQALPAVIAGAKPPPLEDNVYWSTADINVVSYQFFYESGNDHWPMLMGARAVNVLFTMGIGLFVFCWVRTLAGNLAAFVALGLTALSPTLLANGPLATTDASAALLLTLSAAGFWWQLRTPHWSRTLLSATAFGLACVTKFSAVLLLPVFVLLLAVHYGTTPAAERSTRRSLLGLAAHLVIGWVIIWACYGFRFSGFSPSVPAGDHFIMRWQNALNFIGWQAAVVKPLRDWHLLPEAFLFGYTHTYYSSLRRAAFLAGEYSNTGWRTFFFHTFWWKSTPVELVGVVLAAVLAGLRWTRIRPWLFRLAPLLVLCGVYGLTAITSHLNIGHRHLLPLYPTLFIVIALAVARVGTTTRTRVLVAAACLGLQLTVALQIYPHYLAYFNQLAGGPANAWRLLVDSSLDWGQDLPALKTWLDQNNPAPARQPVFISYFGSAEPNYYKIRATRLLFVNGFKLPHSWYEPTGGIYCISATMLQEVYSPVRGEWTLAFEKDYQELRRFEPQFRAFWQDPAARAEMVKNASADRWERAWQRYDLLRHARLCTYLRARGPDAMAGYSILIYRLSATEVDAALRSPYSAWQAAITAAAARPADKSNR